MYITVSLINSKTFSTKYKSRYFGLLDSKSMKYPILQEILLVFHFVCE